MSPWSIIWVDQSINSWLLPGWWGGVLTCIEFWPWRGNFLPGRPVPRRSVGMIYFFCKGDDEGIHQHRSMILSFSQYSRPRIMTTSTGRLVMHSRSFPTISFPFRAPGEGKRGMGGFCMLRKGGMEARKDVCIIAVWGNVAFLLLLRASFAAVCVMPPRL